MGINVGARSVTTNAGDTCIRPRGKAGLGAGTRRSATTRQSEATHFKITMNLGQIQPPVRDCIFIVLLVETAREWAPFAPLDDPLLDPSHGPAIGRSVTESSRSLRYQSNSRRKLFNRLQRGLTWLIRPSSINSPAKGSTDVSASYSQLDTVRFINHRVLRTSASGRAVEARMEPTLIV